MSKFSFLLLIVILLGSFATNVEVSADNSRNKESIQSIKQQTSNVKGKIKEGSQELRNSVLIIQEKGKTNKSYQVITDSMGQFQTTLPEGEFTVRVVEVEGSWFSASQSFTVEDGKVKGKKQGEVQIAKKEKLSGNKNSKDQTITGVLTEGEQGLKGDIVVVKYNEEYEEDLFIISSKKNGEFSASLPEGNYFMYGVSLSDEYYRKDLFFSVNDQELFIDGQKEDKLLVSIPKKRYSGKVMDSSKAIPTAEVVVERVNSEDEYDTELIQYVSTNKNGEFMVRELPDGTYSLGVHHKSYYSWNALTFDVMNGKLVVDGKKQATLDIKIPDLSLKGSVLDGKKSVTDAYLEIEQLSEDGYSDHYYYVEVDQKGNFSYRLQDGFYKIAYVGEANRTTKVDIPFEIKDGLLYQDQAFKASLVIQLPAITLKGTLLDGNKLLQGHVSIEKQSEEDQYEWYGASTDSKGIYSLRLLDGEYRVSYVYLYEENEDLPLSIEFEMRNGQLYVDGVKKDRLDVTIPPVTLHGIVQENGNPIGNGEVSVRSEDLDFYYWKWVNDDGTFTMRLLDGEYFLSEVFLSESSNAYVDLAFEIKDGQLYIDGVQKSVLEVNVPPVTLTGYLVDENGNRLHGDITIYGFNGESEFSYYWGWTNEEGKFSFRLGDGDYQVSYLSFHDGTSMTSALEFSMVDGQLFVNGEPADHLNVPVNPVTLHGKVYNQGKIVRDGYVNVLTRNEEGEWLNWSWIDYDGSFAFRLADGEYEVESVEYYNKEYIRVEMNKPFSIEAGKVIVDGQIVDSLDLHLEEGIQTP